MASLGSFQLYKFVLSISRPVFENMFYGENSAASDDDSVELSDGDNDSVLEPYVRLLRFRYSDEVKMNARNVMRVSGLANRFPSLADNCNWFITDNLDASSVFNTLPLALEQEGKD